MYLQQLDNREQNLFMQLATIIIQSDSVFSTQEKNFLAGYEGEMNRTFEDQNMPLLELHEILLQTQSSSEKTRKIIFLELLALALCDQNFAPNEQSVINEIRMSFDIHVSIQGKMINSIRQLSDVYVEIGEMLGG